MPGPGAEALGFLPDFAQGETPLSDLTHRWTPPPGIESLLVEGSPFELTEEDVLGSTVTVFKNRFPNLRAQFQAAAVRTPDAPYLVFPDRGIELSFADVDPAADISLRETTFVVVDLETTGGRATAAAGGSRDAITEIGAVKVRGGEVLGEFATLVDPQRTIPPQIVQLTGITTATTSASRRPIENQTSAMIDRVARPRWNRSSFAFSLAVSP